MGTAFGKCDKNWGRRSGGRIREGKEERGGGKDKIRIGDGKKIVQGGKEKEKKKWKKDKRRKKKWKEDKIRKRRSGRRIR